MKQRAFPKIDSITLYDGRNNEEIGQKGNDNSILNKLGKFQVFVLVCFSLDNFN
ncbi:MAG: hypothetical protein SV062_10105 [Thermodesulfobacteriota bacterium]|nr:hypothetical protein [Thermodesulfobacteriota bacterium]